MKQKIEKKKFEKSEQKSFEFPKYARMLLNQANQTSQATRKRNVGPISEYVSEFAKEKSENTRENWKEFYYSQEPPEVLEEATEKVYQMLKNFREVANQLDRSDCEAFIRELLFDKSPNGLLIEKFILETLAEKHDVEYKNSSQKEESKGIDGFLGNVPVQVKPESYDSNVNTSYESFENILVVTYKETKKYITINYNEEKFSDLQRRQQKDLQAA